MLKILNHPARPAKPRLVALTAALAVAAAGIGGFAPMPASAAAPVANVGTAAIEQSVRDALASGDQPAVIVRFRGKADLSAAFAMADRTARAAYVHDTLTAFAANTQASALQALHTDYHLSDTAREYTVLWIDNSIAIPALSAPMLESLRDLADVESIRTQRTIMLPVDKEVQAGSAPDAAVSSLARIKVPEVWALGYEGSGIVVANIDSGVRHTHAALVNQYRGNLGGGNFDHNYQWYDPYTHTATPRYSDPHGSHTMGTMVGSNGGNEQIGVAPKAKWINCIGFGGPGGSASDAGLMECGQWMIAPTDLSGSVGTADPSKHPDVVNNSWGDCGRSYDGWYANVIDGWIAAGIAPVFSNGNASNCGYPNNPALNTVGNPGRSGKVLGIGSTGNNNGQYAPHSNKGPTDNPNPGLPVYADHFGFPTVKPNIVAPGVAIRSALSDNDSAYGSMNGTSMSAPAVSGVIGLMWSAAPCLKGDYARTGTILMDTAVRIPVATGSPADGPGNIPNQATGWGEVDALAAVNAGLALCAAGASPRVGTSFAPVNVAVNTTSTLVVTLTNPNATTAMLTADFLDTVPAGLVASAASTTCGGSASLAGANLKLAQGATLPASGSCTLQATVKSASIGSFVNTIAAGALKTDLGDNASAATATLTVTSGAANGIYTSPVLNHAVPMNLNGTSLNLVTGAFNNNGPSAGGTPWDLNFWGIAGSLRLWGISTYQAKFLIQGVDAVVLAPGTVVGPGSTFAASDATVPVAPEWLAGTDGYLGFQFQCNGRLANPVPGVCYGYLQLKTTAPNGFPATVVRYFYDGDGRSITVGATGGGAPMLAAGFTPSSVLINSDSTATLALTNPNPTPATLSADLVDTLPVGLVASAVTTNCGGTADFTAGSFKLAAGATIPANSVCTLSATVRASVAGSYVNTLAAGALKTDLGNSPAATSAKLAVTTTAPFPAPYCPMTFAEAVEAISLVKFAGIDNPSSPNGTVPLEDFLSVPGGGVSRGGTYLLTVQGNTFGPTANKVKVYIDWNQNGVFDADEGQIVGDLFDSNGVDGKQALANIVVPANAVIGTTRMRVTKRFQAAAGPCETVGYGQGEDYTLVIDGNAPPQPIASVTPNALNFTAEQDAASVGTMTVRNDGQGQLRFSALRALPQGAETPAAVPEGARRATLESLARRAEALAVSGAVALPGAIDLLSEAYLPMGNAGLLASDPACDIGMPGLIAHDRGGSADIGYGWNESAGTTARMVDKFTPTSYPATFNTACLALLTNAGLTSAPIKVVVFAADGPGGSPGTRLGSMAATADNIGGGTAMHYQAFDISSMNLSLSSGSVYIGVEWDATSISGLFVAVDQTSVDMAGGYQFKSSWESMAEVRPSYRSLYVRAVQGIDGEPGIGCDAPGVVSWLSVSPQSGILYGVGSQDLRVKVDATGLDVGIHSALLCVNTNDAAHPRFEIPVTFEVTPSIALETVFKDGFDGVPVNPNLVTGIIDQAVLEHGFGSAFDFATGALHPYTDAITSDDINLYSLDPPSINVYWYGDKVPREFMDLVGGVVTQPGGTTFKVLQSGARIGPNSPVSSASQGADMSAFEARINGYIGVAFYNEATGELNFGYLHVTTSAGGFPLRVLDYGYDKSGAAISIP